MLEPFRIDSLSFRGGRIGISQLPGRTGNPNGDIRAIRDWGATIVVSMTTAREMAEAGAGDIGQVLAEMNIRWEHLPIRNFGGPEGESAKTWTELSKTLHDELQDGGSVLLHCRGGQGRAGMIALRLMVESGEDADSALIRLRSVRPGVVESEDQLDWAQRGASCD